MLSRNTWVRKLAAVVLSAVVPLPFITVQASPPNVISGEHQPVSWGIENGCLNSSMVRHFYVLNSHSAVIELVGGGRVLMNFSGDCQGIEQYGFVHTARNNKVCVNSNSIRVLTTGAHCRVQSLEPYP